MRLIWKTVLALIILLIVLWLYITPVFGQGRYDTVNFKQVTLIKIERIMEPGGRTNKLTVVSQTDTAYMYMRYVSRDTWDNVGVCVLMGKEQWEQLIANKPKK